MLGIQEKQCLACGFCTRVLPEIFTLDEYGFAFIKNSPSSKNSVLEEVIKKCPAQCIIWSD